MAGSPWPKMVFLAQFALSERSDEEELREAAEVKGI